MAVTPALAERLVGELRADRQANGRLGYPKRYLEGKHDAPYMPQGAKAEYLHLARRAITNWLPLLSDTFSQGLHVDGYRTGSGKANAKPWDYWQENGLDARQSIVHRGALDYGTAYNLVLPGSVATKRVPLIRPLSPLKSAAWYDDDDADFPVLGMRERGKTLDGATLFEFYDRTTRYTVAEKDGSFHVSREDEHGLGYTPFVRFRDRLDGEAIGIVRPAINLQDRINEIVFSTLIALQYASFRQRWATGMVIPVDESEFLADGVTENPNYGKPVETFEAAVDRLWITDNPDARFGDFAQTEISGHLAMYLEAVRTLAATNQVSPNVFTGDLVNLSGDALAQLEQGTQRRIESFEAIFGEAWEQTFRLAALAAGDLTAARDTSAQVRWRDTEARSFAQTVDALGKLAQMLQVPVEGLWEQIPGVTDQDLRYWKSLREQGDPMQALVSEFTRQTGSDTQTTQATDTAA